MNEENVTPLKVDLRFCLSCGFFWDKPDRKYPFNFYSTLSLIFILSSMWQTEGKTYKLIKKRKLLRAEWS